MTASPYRSRREALKARRATLAAELDEAMAVHHGHRGRRARRRVRRLRLALREVEREVERELYGEPARERSQPRRPRVLLGLLAALVLGLTLISVGAERRTRTADGHTFDPNAVDGADTTPRVELESEPFSR